MSIVFRFGHAPTARGQGPGRLRSLRSALTQVVPAALLTSAALFSAGCEGDRPKAPAAAAAAAAGLVDDAPPPASDVQRELLDGMVAAARQCQEAGGSITEVQRCSGWRLLMTRQRRAIDGFNPRVPESVAPTVERMEVAAHRLAHPDPWLRAVARALIEKGLIASAKEPTELRKPWLAAVVKRLEGATELEERLDLVRLLGNYGGLDEQPALLKAAQASGEPTVRSAAWAGMARCVARGCKPEAATIEAGWQAEAAPEARVGLLVLAGRMKLDALLNWCSPQSLDDEVVGEACRSGLRFLGGDVAFERLYTRAQRLVLNAPADQGETADGIAARALVDLAPLGALAAAGGRYFELVDAYLGQKRVGQGPMQVAQQLLVVPDRERALDLAVKHYLLLSKSERTDQTAMLLGSRLQRVVLTLGGAERIGMKQPERPHGPAAGGPGAHGHDHGHDGHDHGHGHAHGPGDGHNHGHAHGPGDGHNHGAPAHGPGDGHNHGAPAHGPGDGHNHDGHAHGPGDGHNHAPASAPASAPVSAPASAPPAP